MSYSGTLKRDRRLVLLAMLALAALAWGYTVHLGVRHASMAMPMITQWSTADFAFMLVMWAIMMFAMMLPSVTPTVMIFGRVREKRESAGRPFAPPGPVAEYDQHEVSGEQKRGQVQLAVDIEIDRCAVDDEPGADTD